MKRKNDGLTDEQYMRLVGSVRRGYVESNGSGRDGRTVEAASTPDRQKTGARDSNVRSALTRRERCGEDQREEVS